MRPTAGVHFLSRDGDALRGVLDRVDDQLLSFGLTPDERVVTDLPADVVREHAERPPTDGADGAAVTTELLGVADAGAERGGASETVSYARLTGPNVLGRVVREEARGHERVGLQCDERQADVLTGYTVYRYHAGQEEYVEHASADGVFEL